MENNGSAIASLTSLATTKPGMYIFTMVVVMVIATALLWTIWKIVSLIASKAKKIGNDKLGFVDFSNGDNKQSETTSNSKEDPQVTPPVNVSSLINLIIDLPEEAISYNNKITNLKHQLIDDQSQKFRADLRKYRKDVRELYCKAIDVDVNSERGKLFAYWFNDLFSSVDLEINTLLVRNGLNEKTAEQLEDTLRHLYEETFTVIVEGVEDAPTYITNPDILKKIIVDTKIDYRKYLEAGLTHAKKLRCDMQEKFDKERDEYTKKKLEIIQRDFPTYTEQLKCLIK